MAAGSAQELWLKADLAANTSQCTLAYWHLPAFYSGTSTVRSAVLPLWNWPIKSSRTPAETISETFRITSGLAERAFLVA